MSGQKLNIIYTGRYNEGEILSGPEKTARRVFSECEKKHKAFFIQFFFDGRKYGLFKKLFGFEIKDKIITAGLVKLFFLLFRLKPEIIHIITFERFAYIVLLYALFRKVKIIYNSHGVIKYEDSEIKNEHSWHRLKNRFAEKRFLQNSDVIIFNSEISKKLARKYYTINDKKCLIVPNGVDAVFNITETGTRKGCIFFTGEKLHESGRMFLKSFLDFSHFQPDINVIGSKKYCVNIYNSSVKIFNKMKPAELAVFYKDKDIFLGLNKYDTFSITAAEAISAGLIPILTKETGISSYIINGENGFIISYGDKSQLENILVQLCNMPEDKKEEIRNNARKLYNELAWDKVYNMYDNIYHIIRQ